MRGSSRAGLSPGPWPVAIGAMVLVLGLGCGGQASDSVPVPGSTGASSTAVKTAALERAERRAYDGAPPVVPHENFGITCTECHDAQGLAVEGVGFAPPSPHELTAGMSALSRCNQCHVFRVADGVFAANRFSGLRQDLRRGARLNDLAPPTVPHKILMRENCIACHSGPAAREEIRTTHPERVQCRQCHVAVTTHARFHAGDSS